jgi:NAD(P)-dependent dehydrogenase (short-subunit alcohol dehydrogenase family)
MKLNDLFSLEDKVAVVTGALGLLGRQHCTALAEAGANVVAADLDDAGCREFVRTLPTESLAAQLDVTDPVSVRELLDDVLHGFGRVDVLVNNAAVDDKFENPALGQEQSRFERYPLEQWKRVMNVNVTGVFLCAQAIGIRMALQGSGSIINIASTYGIVAPDQTIYREKAGEQMFFKSPAYPASKAAVVAFTKFLASYWGRTGVRVNALSPGGVQNGQAASFIENYSARTPMGRMAAPTDYRGALVFLASDASRYMTGANLVVDGGWTAI